MTERSYSTCTGRFFKGPFGRLGRERNPSNLAAFLSRSGYEPYLIYLSSFRRAAETRPAAKTTPTPIPIAMLLRATARATPGRFRTEAPPIVYRYHWCYRSTVLLYPPAKYKILAGWGRSGKVSWGYCDQVLYYCDSDQKPFSVFTVGLTINNLFQHFQFPLRAPRIRV